MEKRGIDGVEVDGVEIEVEERDSVENKMRSTNSPQLPIAMRRPNFLH